MWATGDHLISCVCQEQLNQTLQSRTWKMSWAAPPQSAYLTGKTNFLNLPPFKGGKMSKTLSLPIKTENSFYNETIQIWPTVSVKCTVSSKNWSWTCQLCDLAIALLGTEGNVDQEICTRIFTTTLFIIAPSWHQPPKGEWIGYHNFTQWNTLRQKLVSYGQCTRFVSLKTKNCFYTSSWLKTKSK